MDINTRLRSIVSELSDQIAADLNSLESEQFAPRYDVDASDDHMKAMKERIIKLRAFRNEIEEVMTGASL